jgi:lipopolysaccharide export system permease protein
MTRIERYVFRTAAAAFLSGLIALTGLVWVTQALREIDIITSKGQSLLVFFSITGLTLPSLMAFIAPVALFAGVLYCLNKLNGDSELVVMSASGVSPGRLLRPFLALFALVFAIEVGLYLEVMPWSFRTIETLTTLLRADFIANLARPGAFTELESGFVFHFRERAPDRSLHGVFMQDRRDPAHITTYISEAGRTVEKDGQTYLVLSKGSYQRPERSGDSAVVTFQDYAIDLSQFMRKGEASKGTHEMATRQLIAPDPKDLAAPGLGGRLRAELLDRLSSPFYAFAAGLVGFAALGEARTTRQGRGMAMAVAVLVFTALRLVGIVSISLVVGNPNAAILVWAMPIGASAVSLDAIFVGPLSRALAAMRRLAFSATRTA